MKRFMHLALLLVVLATCAVGQEGYAQRRINPVKSASKDIEGKNENRNPNDSIDYSKLAHMHDAAGNVILVDTITGKVDPSAKSASSEEPDKREPLYRVLHLDGSTLKHQAETADGVLTLTVSADGAILTGTLRALGYLQNQGIEKITFTDGTHSAELVLADLIAKGHPEDVYVLTLGAENTLTLNGEPIDF